MSTDTAPAAVPGAPEPPSGPATTAANGEAPAKGILASMVAAVEPARPTFDIRPVTGTGLPEDSADGVLDRSVPGVSSASFRTAEEAAAKDPAGEKRKAQGSIWKAWWLAGAQRWAKGGGAANKRLDLKKALAQAHQVKESRTTTVTKSGGLPVRNSMGSGAGSKGGTGKSAGGSRGKGPVNSSGHSSTSGAGRGGSGGGRGTGGSAGGSGAHGGGRGSGTQSGGRSKGHRPAGPVPIGDKTSKGSRGGSGSGSPARKDLAGGGKQGGGHDLAGPKGFKKSHRSGSSTNTAAGPGKQTPPSGKAGAAGKDGKAGSPASPAGPASDGGKTGKNNSKHQPDPRTPLQKSRETGHRDGTAVRNLVDHVKAYKDGITDGYLDTRDKNAKEHARLDKAHHQRKPPTEPPAAGADPSAASSPLKATAHGQTITITDDNTPLEDPRMATPTPIKAQGIDASTITLGDAFLKKSVTRGELRRFKQYEDRLEGRIDGLARVADATKTLAAQARDQATECQQLADQAKSVEGGEKLVGALNKLADRAKAQADEADEVHKKAAKAHDFAKAVLSNVQTRYTPLYQAVVDSDETKPAELKFYADRGITPHTSALAARI